MRTFEYEHAVIIKHELLNEIFLDARDNASYLCDQYYCASPEVEIKQYNGKCIICRMQAHRMQTACHNIKINKNRISLSALDPKAPVTFPYLPAHLYHMLFELLKVN